MSTKRIKGFGDGVNFGGVVKIREAKKIDPAWALRSGGVSFFCSNFPAVGAVTFLQKGEYLFKVMIKKILTLSVDTLR